MVLYPKFIPFGGRGFWQDEASELSIHKQARTKGGTIEDRSLLVTDGKHTREPTPMSRSGNLVEKSMEKKVEPGGIDPPASRMRSGRSTI